MRKGIFSAVVVVMATACWVLAQKASSQPPPSPYGAIPASPPKPKVPLAMPVGEPVSPVPPVEPIKLPETPAPAPVVAPPSPNEPLVAPTTELDFPKIPDVPPAAAPPRTSLSPAASPVVLPPSDPLVVAPPTTPPVAAPTHVIELPPPALPTPPGTVPPAPPPLLDAKLPVRAVTTAAVPGLPPLPGVPGIPPPPTVTSSLPPAVPADGGPLVIPDRAPGLPVANPAGYPVDDPGYWEGRQRFMDGVWAERAGPRFWAGADALLWYAKSARTVPLVQAVTGAAPGDTIFRASQAVDLYPDGPINNGVLGGVRGTVGFWFTPAQVVGLEGSYFWFGPGNGSRDAFDSTPSAVLGRPYVNAVTGRPGLFQVSDLNGTDGTVVVHNAIRIQGGDANFLFAPPAAPHWNVLAGFRYFELDERLGIDSWAVNQDAGYTALAHDSFGTRNQFYGGQVGLRWNYQGRRLFASVTGKIALGAMNERVRINGGTFADFNGGSVSAPGGVLALPTNMGSYSRDRLAFLPELTATLGYRITPWAALSVGYNFMYVSEVVRPGRQIDPSVNPANFPTGSGAGVARPGFQFHGEDFWLQGVNLGVTFRY
jgi:hypothetical protein